MENKINMSVESDITNASVGTENSHFYGIRTESKPMVMYDRKHPALAKGLVFGKPGSGMAFYAKEEILRTLTETDVVLDPERDYQGDGK